MCPRILLATSLWPATPGLCMQMTRWQLRCLLEPLRTATGGCCSSELIVPSSRDPAGQVLQMLLHLWKGHLSVRDGMTSLPFHEGTVDS